MFWNKKPKYLSLDLWSVSIWAILSLVLLVGLLFFKLNSLVAGYTPSERLYLGKIVNLGSITSNPINLPSKLAILGFKHFHYLNLFTSRSISALFATLTIVLFYYVAKSWHGSKVALLATVLFATSSWFLHYGRQATPDSLLLMPLGLLAYGIWLRKTHRSVLVMLIGVVAASLMTYVPGLGLLIVAGIIWQRKAIAEHIKNTKLSLLPIVGIGILVIAPLVWAVIREPHLIKDLVGLPGHLPNPYDYFRHVINIPYQLFIKGPNSPSIWLGRLPLVDFVTTIMIILGVIAYWQLKLDRSKVLAGIIVVGTILSGARGLVSLAILIVPIYLIAAAGLEFLLKQWLSVYPRNPLARSVGWTLVVLAVGLTSYYNLRSYFIAWPEAPATKKVLQKHL